MIPLCEPEIREGEWASVKKCLESGWVSSAGPFVDRFEGEVATYVDVPYAVAVVNGTAGLHVALLVVGVEPNDEVLVSDLTFVAPVNAIHYCGAQPILVDADPDTWQMDIRKVERFLAGQCEIKGGHCFNKRTGRRVRAILPVHILGLACEIDRIADLAGHYKLRVVEDAAEALGVLYGGKHVGTFGDVGVLSFNGNKIVTSGGGGMVVTRDRALAEHARYLTTQAKDDPVEYVHNEVGYNYRLTNLQAALGVAQLERIEEFVGKKHRIFEAYEKALGGLPGIALLRSAPETRPTYWLSSLISENLDHERRRTLVRRLNEEEVGVRSLWNPIHDLRPYRACQTVEIEHAPRIHERAVSLPSSVGLTARDVKRCAKRVGETLQACAGVPGKTGEGRFGKKTGKEEAVGGVSP